MRFPTSRLPLVLRSAAIAIVATTEAASAQDTAPALPPPSTVPAIHVGNEPIQDDLSILWAMAMTKLGVGSLQPYGRWQWFSPTSNGAELKSFAVDAGLNYLITGRALRIMLVYEHVDLGNHRRSDVGQLGAQAIFF